jgi:hypothetical protein
MVAMLSREPGQDTFSMAIFAQNCWGLLMLSEMSQFSRLDLSDVGANFRSALGKPLTVVVHSPTWIAETWRHFWWQTTWVGDQVGLAQLPNNLRRVSHPTMCQPC